MRHIVGTLQQLPELCLLYVARALAGPRYEVQPSRIPSHHAKLTHRSLVLHYTVAHQVVVALIQVLELMGSPLAQILILYVLLQVASSLGGIVEGVGIAHILKGDGESPLQ